MIVDGVRLLTEWLSDGVTGVNAQLGNVPRTAPEPAPAAVAIYNEVDHPWVARVAIPEELLVDGDGNPRRLLMVLLHPDPQGFVAQLLPEYEATKHTVFPFVVLYAVRKIQRSTPGLTVSDFRRDARQSVRTAMRVVAQHFDNANSSFTKNDCVFSLPETDGATLNSEFVDPAGDLVIDSLVVPLRVQDRWALGIS